MPAHRLAIPAWHGSIDDEIGSRCRAGLFIDPVAMPAPRVHKTTTRHHYRSRSARPCTPIVARHHLRFSSASARLLDSTRHRSPSSTCVHSRNYAAVIYRSILRSDETHASYPSLRENAIFRSSLLFVGPVSGTRASPSRRFTICTVFDRG